MHNDSRCPALIYKNTQMLRAQSARTIGRIHTIDQHLCQYALELFAVYNECARSKKLIALMQRCIYQTAEQQLSSDAHILVNTNRENMRVNEMLCKQ